MQSMHEFNRAMALNPNFFQQYLPQNNGLRALSLYLSNNKNINIFDL